MHSFLHSFGPGSIVFYDYFKERRTFRTDLSWNAPTPLHVEQAVSEMFGKDAVLVVESDSNVSRDNPDQAEFGFTSAMIQRLVPAAEPGKWLDKATFLSGWLDEDASMAATNKEAVIAFRPSAVLTHGGLRISFEGLSVAGDSQTATVIDVVVNGKWVGTINTSQYKGIQSGHWEVSVPAEVLDDVLVTEVVLRSNTCMGVSVKSIVVKPLL